MNSEEIRMAISVFCSVVCTGILLFVIVAGHVVRESSARHEVPKYWTRPWILAGSSVSYMLNISLYYADFSCTSYIASTAFSLAYDIFWVILAVNILISLYDPYILSGKKQLIIWIILLAMSLILAAVVAVLFTVKTVYPSKNVHSSESTTSGLSNLGSHTPEVATTTSVLDSLDMEFTWRLLTTQTAVTFQAAVLNVTEENQPVVTTTYDQDMFVYCNFGQEFFLLTSLVHVFLAICTLPALWKRCTSKIQKRFKACHSPLTNSQKFVSQWSRKQHCSSAIFLLLHAIYFGLYIACSVRFQNTPISRYFFEYVTVAYPLISTLSCFILMEFRSMFLNICTMCCCKRSRSGASSEPQQGVEETCKV